MTDYAMCRAHKCLKKNDCARYRMKPGRWQSCTTFDCENTGYRNFWDINTEEVPFDLNPPTPSPEST